MAELYLLTNDDPVVVLLNKLECAMATGGVSLLQYRRKNTPPAERLAEAQQILQLCQYYHVPLIINDDMQLAYTLGCGVHLGQGDGSAKQARQLLGKQAIIGVTCHQSIKLAKQAQQDGASYVAFGTVFASITKPHATSVSKQVLQQIEHLNMSTCAIGGINLTNIAQLTGLHLTYIAVIQAILGLPVEKITQHCIRWQQALDNL